MCACTVINNYCSVSLQIDILVNLLGFSLPIPTCFTKDISAVYVALLGLVPPLLVTLVTIIYVLRYITCTMPLFVAIICDFFVQCTIHLCEGTQQ